MKTYIFLLLPLLMSLPLAGQELSRIKDSKPVTISGGANANCSMYDATGMNSRRDPFSYTLSGNINFNVFGVLDLPFSFYYTKKNSTYNQPSFSNFGVSPRYKFITLHAGYRSMVFSNYSLAGLTFLGGGIEVMPDKSFIRGKAMYGRLVKAVPVGDTLSLKLNKPVYDRWAFGTMITLGKNMHTVDLIMFKAWDVKKSLTDTIITDIHPHENLILGISTKQKIAERILFTGEFAQSAFSANTFEPGVTLETYRYANHLGGLFKPRYSSKFNNALNANIEYTGDAFSLGAVYTRVDPEYASMGSSYISNDIEEYQITGSTALFHKKLSISGNFGRQHNDLEKQLESKNVRTIVGVNLSMSLKNALNFTLSYSNFMANTSPTQVILSDSINYVQVTENYSGNANYNWGTEKLKHSLTLIYSMQTANTLDKQVENVTKTGTKINNGSLNYRWNYLPAEIAATFSYSVSTYQVDSSKSLTHGPVISLTKSFLNKQLSPTFSYSAQRTTVKHGTDNNLNVFRLSVAYRISKHHAVNVNSNLIYRKNINRTESLQNQKSHEFIGTLAYNYSF
jgi:hypothetical protein